MKTLLLSLLATCCSALAADPLFGTWQVNFSRSTGLEAQISTFRKSGAFLENVNGRVTYKFKLDGKEYPVTGSSDSSIAIWRKTGALSFEHEMKQDGKTVYKVVTVVSADGKTRTWQNTRTNADGALQVSQGLQERVAGDFDPANPLLGEWRLVPIAKIEAIGDGIRYAYGSLSFTARFDGLRYPVNGSTNYDSVLIERSGTNSVKLTYRSGDIVRNVTEWAVSADGQSLLSKVHGTRADGQPIKVVVHFDRQA